MESRDGRASRRRRAEVRTHGAVRHRRHLVAFEDEVRAALEEAADLGGALRAARAVLVRNDVVREDVRLALAVVGERVGVQFLPADADIFDLAVHDFHVLDELVVADGLAVDVLDVVAVEVLGS